MSSWESKRPLQSFKGKAVRFLQRDNTHPSRVTQAILSPKRVEMLREYSQSNHFESTVGQNTQLIRNSKSTTWWKHLPPCNDIHVTVAHICKWLWKYVHTNAVNNCFICTHGYSKKLHKTVEFIHTQMHKTNTAVAKMCTYLFQMYAHDLANVCTYML